VQKRITSSSKRVSQVGQYFMVAGGYSGRSTTRILTRTARECPRAPRQVNVKVVCYVCRGPVREARAKCET
jgi:hypothetical protein